MKTWWVIAITDDGASQYRDWDHASDSLVDEDGIFYGPVYRMFEVSEAGISAEMDSDQCEDWACSEGRRTADAARYPHPLAPGIRG